MHNRQATIQPSIKFAGILAWVLAGVMVLAACSQAVQPGTVLSPTTASETPVSPTRTTPTPGSSALSPTSTPLPSLTPAPDCKTQLGQVEEMALDTPRMYEPFKFRVYLPPCYEDEADRFYPVLYLFHGLFYSNDQWTRLGAVEVANRLILTDQVAPFIIVMPYDPNQREPVSTTFDEVFMEDLLPFIDVNFRTLSEPAYRAVGGLSRGAGWAIHFGLTHPTQFGVIGAHSPIVFWEDSTEIDSWLGAIPRSKLPRFYLDIGLSDPNQDSTVLLETLLTDRNIPHEYHINSGYHTEQYWASQVENYLRWYAAGW